MNRMTSLGCGLLLIVAPFAYAQDLQDRPLTAYTSNSLRARQLVAWTWMQEPQPVLTQLFIGRIIRVGGTYVLKVPGNTLYHMDEQAYAKQFEKHEVRLIGNLETRSNTIRIVKIDLLSQTQSPREVKR